MAIVIIVALSALNCRGIRTGAVIQNVFAFAKVAGVLALIGRWAPTGLRVFLTALAIVDDLLAVVVIALFYTASVDATALANGATSTKFAEVANSSAAAKRGAFGATPESVVADALKGFEKGKTYVVSGGGNYFNAAVLPRFLPRQTVIGIVGNVFRKIAKGE